jgi:hypothetical protein
MTIPGFTAEASLYRTGAPYELAADHAAKGRTGYSVIPQRIKLRCVKGCFCDEFGCSCNYTCEDKLD